MEHTGEFTLTRHTLIRHMDFFPPVKPRLTNTRTWLLTCKIMQEDERRTRRCFTCPCQCSSEWLDQVSRCYSRVKFRLQPPVQQVVYKEVAHQKILRSKCGAPVCYLTGIYFNCCSVCSVKVSVFKLKDGQKLFFLMSVLPKNNKFSVTI